MRLGRSRGIGMAFMLALAALVALLPASQPAPLAAQAATPAGRGVAETRALWVLRGSLTSPERIDRLVANAAGSGFNTLLLQIRGRGDAYYASTLEPRGVGVPASFDPLAYAIAKARAANLRVHVWFNVNLVASVAQMPTDRRHVVVAHPEWLMVPRPLAAELGRLGSKHPRYVRRLADWTRAHGEAVEGLYASPVTAPAARHVERLITDIVTRYPVSGVHLDYIRYPSNLFDHSPAALDAFYHAVRGELAAAERRRLDDRLRRDPLAYADALPDRWLAFRRLRLADLVARIRGAVRRVRPEAMVTAAVIPDAQDAFENKLQDWPDWARRGLIDAFCPMAYTSSLPAFNRQVAAASRAAAPRPVWAGIGAYRLTPAQTIDHIAAARRNGAAGVVLFSYDSLVEPGGDRLGDIGRAAFPPRRADAAAATPSRTR
jgi:uncharacterized lipoprotein YddW (UPF0748 family)